MYMHLNSVGIAIQPLAFLHVQFLHILLSLAVTVEDLEASRQASRDMHSALRARKEVLEAALHRKVAELRQLCLSEGEITGEVPFEYPLSPGEPLPLVPRRVTTGFTLSRDFLYKDQETEVRVVYGVVVLRCLLQCTCITLVRLLTVTRVCVWQAEEQVSKLALEYELQQKITEAALRLAKDPTVAKNVRKKRKLSYHKSSQKV